MRRLSSRCTRPLGIFKLTLPRCLAAGRRGSTARTISRLCWCSPGSGATPKICRKRVRPQPGDAAVSHRIAPGKRHSHRESPRVPNFHSWTVGCGSGAGRQRFLQARPEVGGSGTPILRQTGQGGQLPGRDVPGLCQPVGTGTGGQAAVSARVLGLNQSQGEMRSNIG